MESSQLIVMRKGNTFVICCKNDIRSDSHVSLIDFLTPSLKTKS